MGGLDVLMILEMKMKVKESAVQQFKAVVDAGQSENFSTRWIQAVLGDLGNLKDRNGLF